jgi:hypothetical protein
MQGYLMYECGSSDPLGNVNVSFVSNGTAYLSTTTDAYGYFRLKGDYEIQVGGAEAYESFLNIEYTGQNGGGFGSIKLMRNPPDVFNDSLFLNNSTLSVLIIETGVPSFGSDNDTLKVEYSDISSNGRLYKKYVGPFKNGEILDTLLTPTDSHIGYANGLRYPSACGYYINNTNYHTVPYPWVTGQPNNACGNYTDVYLKLD